MIFKNGFIQRCKTIQLRGKQNLLFFLLKFRLPSTLQNNALLIREYFDTRHLCRETQSIFPVPVVKYQHKCYVLCDRKYNLKCVIVLNCVNYKTGGISSNKTSV